MSKVISRIGKIVMCMSGSLGEKSVKLTKDFANEFEKSKDYGLLK